MIKNFKPRLYQETIFATCVSKNTLVVLPTGMGKTNIFLMVASQRLKQYPSSKILFIGPTRPLIEQYKNVFTNHFEIDENLVTMFTGQVTPKKRAELWKTSQIIFSTPQGLENDILSKRIDLSDVSLLGVDEAHRSTGDYAYVFVAKQYNKSARFPRILALTASPGSDVETIGEVCKNLYIEEIEVRTDSDPDVKPYVQDVKVDWVKVDLPESFSSIKKYLEQFLLERYQKLKSWDLLPKSNFKYVSKTDLLTLSAQIRGRISSGEKDPVLWGGISILAEIMKVGHAVELLETQGIEALYMYLKNLNDQSLTTKVKAVKNLVKDLNFRSALIKTDSLYEEKVMHPKLIELLKIVKEEIKQEDAKLIVFNNFRDNAVEVERELNKVKNVRAKLFVGQTKKGETGMSQKVQKEVIEKFSKGTYNILVATSIGEEGLDIPKVDAVVFYEPVASAIRSIQRRGRTGRLERGKVIILMAKNTRDEGYRWAAHHKEKRMYRTLDALKEKLSQILGKNNDQNLNKFIPKEEAVKIYVDHREKGSGVIKELANKNVEIQLEQLPHADFILSNRVAVEFKNTEDFIQSIIDGRLLIQLKDLKVNFPRPLVIIEGQEDLYSIRNIHENAIRGMLSTIAVSYGIPILRTKNPKDTAGLLYTIAKREQEALSKDFSLHGEKREMSLTKWQEFIVSSFPGIGPALAKPLLKRFKTIKKLINAKESTLQKVDKIGPTKARRIKEVLEKEYTDEK
tara:strand:+ start:2830 stop:5049 length:2220 start_codon:yes stop_codon:yes gene_type:complete